MNLENENTILSDWANRPANERHDAVLLYDVFHGLSHEDAALSELHGVLKRDGILFFCDHHINGDGILSRLSEDNMFKPPKKGKKT